MSKKKKKINKISIKLFTPEEILNESYGEVLNPETINYRTHKPEKNGLFCERIFGPINDYECSCGKYKNIKYKGIFCDRCGIEITRKKVRRERIGHIKLSVPIVHIWFFRCLPNKISYLMGKSSKEIESIIYYEKYIILQTGKLKKYKNQNGKYIKKLDLINEEEYNKILEFIPKNNNLLKDEDKNKFIVKIGGYAIYHYLKNLNIEKLFLKYKNKLNQEKSKYRKKENLKKLQIINLFRIGYKKKTHHKYIVLKFLPIIPPDLRPLVTLDNGKYASSDLNDLYRKIIIRNNRLKKLIEIQAPEVILKNEKRMLQESVDSLFDNSKTKKNVYVKSESKRILKSLSDILKGKQGRFRQNLLGKRVDYSARSVIVVEPNLKLHQCGLPIEIALELYKPFIINKLINRGVVKNIKSANKIINNKKKIVSDILYNLVKGHPILLNRAPTLHRFSIQAFQPILIKSRAIQLHPLVCSAFNADFDGDQMAVHLPLSIESILEAQLLMLSPQNILNISNGHPIIIPSQDIILGLYYMTMTKSKKDKKKIKNFYSIEEVIIAYNLKIIKLHDYIKLKIKNKDNYKLINTTVGRAIFNNIIPNKKKIGYINKLINKNNIKNIIIKVLYNTNIPETSKFLDKLKKIGFYNSFKGGLSFNIKDIMTPKEKYLIINKTIKKINKIFKVYNMGLITNNERYNKIINEWSNATSKISNIVINNIKNDKNGFNNVYMMLDSGARSSKEQIRQLSGMRGLMAKPQKYSAEIIENPILSNFLEGLSVLEYFISTHGSRKGLADTALKTADAGYLTRRLVDVGQDVIIKEKDCKTINGITIYNKHYNLSDSEVLGRVVLFDVLINNKIIIKKGNIIDKNLIKKINKKKIYSIKIRSPLTCETKNGICSKCYGINLSKNQLVQIGEAVGVIAAQSIGEPGTQLTLRTFHVGGSASDISEETEIISKYNGKIVLKYLKYIKKKKKYIVVSRYTEIKIIDEINNSTLFNKNIPYGSFLYFKNNDIVKIGDKIYKWDPYNAILISEYSGIVKYNNIKKNITYKLYIDENTGYNEKIIIESKNKNIIPSFIIINKKGKKIKNYNLPIGSYLNVKNNDKINKGKILIKIPRKYSKSKDITGGLPRLSELFEVRKTYNPATISEIDGIVSYGKVKKGSVEIFVKSSKFNKKIKYIIKTSKQILVQENDYIKHGSKLSDGIFTFNDILKIKGIKKIQKYLIKKLQDVYKSQGVQINNKHFEIIINQMMKKVKIIDSGDTNFIKGSIIYKEDFLNENKKINKMVIIEKCIDYKKFYKGQIINKKELKIENEYLKMKKKKKIISRKALPAIAKPILQGITKSALHNKSFISSASFQETTRVLSESAISYKTDYLQGLKENVIIGNKIPAGTGFKSYDNSKIKVKSKKIYTLNK
ncbi:MAG: DNA-directed RNA polymerase subunit beta', partial [Candidatus Shikimatogenerans bostrichidophilus]